MSSAQLYYIAVIVACSHIAGNVKNRDLNIIKII